MLRKRVDPMSAPDARSRAAKAAVSPSACARTMPSRKRRSAAASVICVVYQRQMPALVAGSKAATSCST
jgi:hypothetical protein